MAAGQAYKGKNLRISVDGDTSTNDTVLILANGLAENTTITEKNENYQIFVEALKYITISMAKMLAKVIPSALTP